MVCLLWSPIRECGDMSHRHASLDHQARARIGDPARIQFERIINQSERALARGEPETARQLLFAAVRGQLPRQYRAWLAARLLLLTPQTDDESKLRSDVRNSIDLGLCGEWLFDTDGIPITLGALLDRHIGRGSPSVLAQSAQKHCPWERPIAPLLDPGSDIVRTLKLPPGSAPLRRIPGSSVRPRHLFATTDAEMIAISIVGGEITRFVSQEQLHVRGRLGRRLRRGRPDKRCHLWIGPSPSVGIPRSDDRTVARATGNAVSPFRHRSLVPRAFLVSVERHLAFRAPRASVT